MDESANPTTEQSTPEASSAPDPSFRIITSLLYHPSAFTQDCPFYHFTLHRDRLLRAADYFNSHPDPTHAPGAWHAVIDYLKAPDGPLLAACLRALADSSVQDVPAKLRIALGPSSPARPEITFDAIPCSPMENLFPGIPLAAPPPPPGGGGGDLAELHCSKLDSVPTKWRDELVHKTSARDVYTAARQREVKGHVKEVILWDPTGDVLEGSITNVYFWRHARWTGTRHGVDGTIRRHLREQGAIDDHVGVNKESVPETGEWVLLSNGCRGVFLSWLLPDGKSSIYAEADRRIKCAFPHSMQLKPPRPITPPSAQCKNMSISPCLRKPTYTASSSDRL